MKGIRFASANERDAFGAEAVPAGAIFSGARGNFPLTSMPLLGVLSQWRSGREPPGVPPTGGRRHVRFPLEHDRDYCAAEHLTEHLDAMRALGTVLSTGLAPAQDAIALSAGLLPRADALFNQLIDTNGWLPLTIAVRAASQANFDNTTALRLARIMFDRRHDLRVGVDEGLRGLGPQHVDALLPWLQELGVPRYLGLMGEWRLEAATAALVALGVSPPQYHAQRVDVIDALVALAKHHPGQALTGLVAISDAVAAGTGVAWRDDEDRCKLALAIARLFSLTEPSAMQPARDLPRKLIELLPRESGLVRGRVAVLLAIARLGRLTTEVTIPEVVEPLNVCCLEGIRAAWRLKYGPICATALEALDTTASDAARRQARAVLADMLEQLTIHRDRPSPCVELVGMGDDLPEAIEPAPLGAPPRSDSEGEPKWLWAVLEHYLHASLRADSPVTAPPVAAPMAESHSFASLVTVASRLTDGDRLAAHEAAQVLAKEFPRQALPVLIRLAPHEANIQEPFRAMSRALAQLATEDPRLARELLCNGVQMDEGEAPLLLQHHPSAVVRAAAARATGVLGVHFPEESRRVLAVLRHDPDDNVRWLVRYAHQQISQAHGSRLQPKGQYVPPSGAIASLLDDPNTPSTIKQVVYFARRAVLGIRHRT